MNTSVDLRFHKSRELLDQVSNHVVRKLMHQGEIYLVTEIYSCKLRASYLVQGRCVGRFLTGRLTAGLILNIKGIHTKLAIDSSTIFITARDVIANNCGHMPSPALNVGFITVHAVTVLQNLLHVSGMFKPITCALREEQVFGNRIMRIYSDLKK
jgi:hypothetical protein